MKHASLPLLGASPFRLSCRSEFLLSWPLFVLAFGSAFILAAAQAQDFEGRSVNEWKNRTNASFTIQERQEAVCKLGEFWDRAKVPGFRVTEEEIRAAKEIATFLIGLLDDPSGDIRLEAVKALGGSFAVARSWGTPPEALPGLMRLTADPDPEIRRIAAGDIVAIRPLAEKEIAQLLRHQDVTVRRAAAKALLDHRPTLSAEVFQRFEDALLQIVNSDSEFCRKNVHMLGNLGPKAVPALVKLLVDKTPKIRSEAAHFLGHLGPAAKEAVPDLKRLLTDYAEWPTKAAGWRRVCDSAADALNRILKDQDYRIGLPAKRSDDR